MVLIVPGLPGYPKWILSTFWCFVTIPLTLKTIVALVSAFLTLLALTIESEGLHRFRSLAKLLLDALYLFENEIGTKWT